jgi:hypothetical protein
LNPGPEKLAVAKKTYRRQAELTEIYEKLGMVKGAWSCACYVPEIASLSVSSPNL